MATIDRIIPKYFNIRLLSGLHIWAGKPELQIGGNDNPIVRHQITQEPYIPWSSLKWRMRALIEMREYGEEINGKWDPIQDPNNIVAKAFGCAMWWAKISSRLIFSDFMFTKQRKEKFLTTDGEFTEMKQENMVPRFDRKNANPRPMERVPSGVEFVGMITMIPISGWQYDISEEALTTILQNWQEYLMETYIWWGGSRGNGKIEIQEITKEEYNEIRQ